MHERPIIIILTLIHENNTACNQVLVGSIQSRCRAATVGMLFTEVSQSPSSIIWYWSHCGNALKLGR